MLPMCYLRFGQLSKFGKNVSIFGDPGGYRTRDPLIKSHQNWNFMKSSETGYASGISDLASHLGSIDFTECLSCVTFPVTYFDHLTMPRVTLTDRKIAGLKPAAGQVDYFDRALPGFGVRVSPNGRKTFVLLYRANQTLRRLSLGVYPIVGLAKARKMARDAVQAATIGRDPAAERHLARGRTFAALGALYIEQHAKRKKRSWRSDARIIRRELEAWSDRPVAAIRRADVREVLEAIVQRGAPVLANRVLACVRKILSFAVEREWLEANVASKMARPARESSRSRVLTEDEIRTVWVHLDQPPPEDLPAVEARQWKLTRAALKLRLLTAQRGKEVVSMRWKDIEGGWWTIPGGVTKNKLDHRVPVTAEARKILDTLKADASGDHVFVGIRGTRQRRGALADLKLTDVRPHDFRRTAASMMASGGIQRLVISKLLNHVEAGVTGVYDRHSYDAEKMAALTWWDNRLTTIVNGV